VIISLYLGGQKQLKDSMRESSQSFAFPIIVFLMNISLRAVPALLLTTSLTLGACSLEGKDEVTMAASTKSGIYPLGDTNFSMKTSRRAELVSWSVTNVRLGEHDSFERLV